MYRIPDRVQIFMASFWLWTWFLLQFSRICQIMLKFILKWVPDNYLPGLPECLKKSPIKLVRALDHKGRNITNRLNLFLNLTWDNKIENETGEQVGGINVSTFSRYIETTAIWIVYLLEYNINLFDDEIDESSFEELLKAIWVDVEKKLVYRQGDSDESPLLFGELTF